MPNRSYPDDRCRRIIDWYFGETSRVDCGLEELKARTKLWFFRNPDTDATIRVQFETDVADAARGALDAWNETPAGALGLVVLLDQFPRNLNRDSPRAFGNDAKAIAIAFAGVEKKHDAALSAAERLVFYLPLMHAEDRATQRRSCALYEKLAEDAPAELRPELANASLFAEKHRTIVERFGRFPHRNKALGRPSTEEEIEFLKQPGSSF